MTKVQKMAGAVAAFALMTGIALAQSVPTVTVTPVQPGFAIAPGTTGVTVSTITLAGNQSGTFQIASFPITLSGGASGNLANCQVFNAAGQALTTGVNVVSSAQLGSNTIMFDTPLTVTAGSPTTLTLRCNVSTSTVAGTAFQFTAGTPVFAPGVAVNLAVSPSVSPGQQNAVLAFLSLDATRSGQGVRFTSLPITASFSGASNLTNCEVRSLSNIGVPLNTGVNVVGTLGSGVNVFTLDTPLTVNAGTATTLALTCDVSGLAPVGSTATFSVTPGAISAVSAQTAASITPGAGGPSGTAGITQGTLTFRSTAAPPGVPDTGGDVLFPTLLLAAGVALLFGYLYRRFA
ncbi:MAG: hypothetical protein HY460_00805 [Parcubacteria group bacterium]|nr:hypothetical protein [Parcubacteria group bacterium]